VYWYNALTGQSSWERPNELRSEAKRPRLGEGSTGSVEPLALFNTFRQRLLAEGSFLDMVALEQALRRHYGERQRLPAEIHEALGGLQRMMASVSSALTVAFATHHVLALRDLEAWVLSSSRDFEGVASFAQLYLGPLGLHPVVLRHMPRAHGQVLASPQLAALDATSVVAHVATNMDLEGGRRGGGFGDGLQALAREVGLRDASELPIFVKGEGYVTSLVSRCLAARHHAEQQAERQTGEMAYHRRHAAVAAADFGGTHTCQRGLGPAVTAGGVADHPVAQSLDALVRTAQEAAATLLAEKGEAADLARQGVRSSLEAASTATSASSAASAVLSELRASWSECPVLSWALPRLSSLSLPLAEAKQIVREHAKSGSSRPLEFPPVFDNVRPRRSSNPPRCRPIPRHPFFCMQAPRHKSRPRSVLPSATLSRPPSSHQPSAALAVCRSSARTFTRSPKASRACRPSRKAPGPPGIS
jgi:hypothetical protein